MGISRQCAHRWVARFDAEGWAGLRDRSSRGRIACPTRTPRRRRGRRGGGARRAAAGPGPDRAATGVPARTVDRILARHGVPPIAAWDPITGPYPFLTGHRHRYERDAPGDLVHVDVKKIGGSPTAAAGGSMAAQHRSTRHTLTRSASTTSTPSSTTTPGSPTPRSPDEKGATGAGVPARAPPTSSPRTGSPIRRGHDRQRLRLHGARSTSRTPSMRSAPRQLFIKPHCPWQNGKVERFNRTLQPNGPTGTPSPASHRPPR